MEELKTFVYNEMRELEIKGYNKETIENRTSTVNVEEEEKETKEVLEEEEKGEENVLLIVEDIKPLPPKKLMDGLREDSVISINKKEALGLYMDFINI